MKSKIRAGDYEFDGKEWKDVSEEAKSTIRRMLTVNPAERITIDEILNCSWLNEPASARPIDMSSLSDAENRNQIQVSHNYDLFLI
jgi:serine/threonine protein kinase